MIPDYVSLPDELERQANRVDDRDAARLMREAAKRIVELEVAVLRLRNAIGLHRETRGNWIGYEPCDQKLWEQVADVPHHDIKGDG